MNRFLIILFTITALVRNVGISAQVSEHDHALPIDEIPLSELLKGDTVPSSYHLAEFISNQSNRLRKKEHDPLTREDTLVIIRKVKEYIRDYPAKVKAQEEYARQKHERETTAFREYLDSLRNAGVEIDGHVYHRVARRPGFSNINRFFARNFRYPKEAWKRERSAAVQIEGIVLKDGSMIEMAYDGATDPELIAELERVVKKMKWTPGNNGNGPLNVIRGFSVELTPWKDKGSTVPYGLENVVKNGRTGMAALRKTAYEPTSADKTTSLEDVGECARLFPELTDVSVPYLSLLSAYGDKENVLAMADTMLMCLNPHRYVKKDHNMRPLDRSYNGKSEILLSLMRLIQHSHYGIEGDSAYADVDGLIMQRIVDGDLYSRWSDKKRHQQRIEQLQRDMVMEFSKGQAGLDREAPVYQKITRDYSIDELSRGLAYWSERGMIDNAAVGQLSALIDSEYDLMRKGKGVTGKDRLNLFGIKALAVWLQDGEGGMRDFIAGVKGGDASKQLVKYLDKLQKRYDENAPAMADREGVIEALACLVPPLGTDEAGCKAFYERRRAAEKVFPIKWLAGK